MSIIKEAWELEKPQKCEYCGVEIDPVGYDGCNHEDIYNYNGYVYHPDCVDELIKRHGAEYLRATNKELDYIKWRGFDTDYSLSGEEINAFLNNTPEVIEFIEDKEQFIVWWVNENEI